MRALTLRDRDEGAAIHATPTPTRVSPDPSPRPESRSEAAAISLPAPRALSDPRRFPGGAESDARAMPPLFGRRPIAPVDAILARGGARGGAATPRAPARLGAVDITRACQLALVQKGQKVLEHVLTVGRHFGRSHCAGREAGGWEMTTVWEPDLDELLARVAEMEGADDVKAEVEAADGDGANRGTKRKRAPPTKGPCEHGVKYRSNCTVCRACPHGKRRSRCQECGGASICEHGRQRSQCKECGGSQICEHDRQRPQCKECGGSQICEHGRERHRCKECGGASICEHGRHRQYCKECGGASICEHGRQRRRCKECGGSQICGHGRRRSTCKECKKM